MTTPVDDFFFVTNRSDSVMVEVSGTVSGSVSENIEISVTAFGEKFQEEENYETSVSEIINITDSTFGIKSVTDSAIEDITISANIIGIIVRSGSTNEFILISPESGGIAIKPPTNVNANEIADNTVRITWDVVSGAQNGYAVERDGDVIAEDIMDNEYIDEDVPLGERVYRVGTLV